jgi:oligo-1,6-glucosidase
MHLVTISEADIRGWWKEGTVYQIYPASFKDSNGDGVGDIPGIISKLDYLKDLGVDILWLSPHYKSPQVDMGYDISDYKDVHAPYGTLQDVKDLIAGCHKRNMKLIFDLVVNHTSNEHPWFQESRKSKDSPKRDWYIWRPARYDEQGNRLPPCNWCSFFNGSAWQWDEQTQEYYLHLFAKEQPDLNWENEAVRQAIYDEAMKFWLDLGVDGFRVDTVNMYSKVLPFKDAPITVPTDEYQPAQTLFCNGPRMHEFLTEMNDQVLSHYDAMTVGELSSTPDPKQVLEYVGASAKQLNMVFQMDMVHLGLGPSYKYDFHEWHLSQLKDALVKWQQFIIGNDGWTTAFLENHDQARSISRFCSDDPLYHSASGKMLATFLCTLTGTLFIYQGQEIGMINLPKSWPIEEYKDIESIHYYNYIKEKTHNDPKAVKLALENIGKLGRDHSRSPFQWDDTEHAGFTTGTPWMRVNDVYPEINAKLQENDETSILSFWKKAVQFRNAYKDFCVYGDFYLCDSDNLFTVTYIKVYKCNKMLVVLNFTKGIQDFVVPAEVNGKLELIFSNTELGDNKKLSAFEARVYLVK